MSHTIAFSRLRSVEVAIPIEGPSPRSLSPIGPIICNYLRGQEISAMARCCRDFRDIARLEQSWETATHHRFVQLQSYEGSIPSGHWRTRFFKERTRVFVLMNIPRYAVTSEEWLGSQYEEGRITRIKNYMALVSGRDVRLRDLRVSGSLSSLVATHQSLVTVLQFTSRWLVTAAPAGDTSVYIIDLQNPRVPARRIIIANLNFQMIVTEDKIIASIGRQVVFWSLAEGTQLGGSEVYDRRITAMVPWDNRIVIAREGDIVHEQGVAHERGRLALLDDHGVIQETIDTNMASISQMGTIGDRLFVINERLRLGIYDLRNEMFLGDFEEEGPIIRIALVGERIITLILKDGASPGQWLVARCWKYLRGNGLAGERLFIGQAWFERRDSPTLSMEIVGDAVCLRTLDLPRFAIARLSARPSAPSCWRMGQIDVDRENSLRAGYMTISSLTPQSAGRYGVPYRVHFRSLDGLEPPSLCSWRIARRTCYAAVCLLVIAFFGYVLSTDTSQTP